MKTHYLRFYPVAIGRQHGAAASHRKFESYCFHYQSRNPGKVAGNLEGLSVDSHIAAALEKLAPLVCVRGSLHGFVLNPPVANLSKNEDLVFHRKSGVSSVPASHHAG
jgi:hypothetical protein